MNQFERLKVILCGNEFEEIFVMVTFDDDEQLRGRCVEAGRTMLMVVDGVMCPANWVKAWSVDQWGHQDKMILHYERSGAVWEWKC